MNNNSIEIQEFLNAVSEDVKKNDDPCDIISFSDFWDQKHCANDLEFDQRCFLGDVTQLEICNQISYYKKITSYKQRFLPVVRIFTRMIRTSVSFLFLPLVAEQNNVNANISRIMTNFRGYVNADCQKKALDKSYMKEMESRMQAQIFTQNQLIEELNDTIAKLNNRINELENGRGGSSN